MDMAPIVIDGKVVGAVSISKAMTEVHTLYQQLKKHKEKVDILEKTIGSMAKARYTFEDIIGKEGGLRTTVTMARKAAETDLPVLITGESGTGKELFAQAIHNKSTRANGPFVPVNCSAIPNELLESELFGYEEGAFTAAKRGGKVGLFELADHGTIFLDEIGDLSYHLQAKLLRVLQEKTVRRVGGTRERTVNLRIIAATNKNLDQLIRKSRFREDLYYRLSVVNLHIPPLRERKEDLLPLIYFFLGNSTVESGKPCYSISEEAINVLQSYDWPGNVRELKNAIEYATCMANDWTITVEDLPGTVPRTPKMTKKPSSTLKAKIRELELETIRATIEKYGNSTGAKKRAAQELGISLATLYNKMNSFPKS
ncbi:MAG TPA: sigma 54-interacting transcriptional regulator [Alicyclobacillus sp.]|nr:sigma 54-interacting transcriptional regulator [Alicyclobacillus sp.]